MRIRAVKVDRYGPLNEFAATDMGVFTLIRGPNEEGKTLLIDALLRLLFRKHLGRVKAFGNMARVSEPPEGYVVLEIDGQEVKIGRGDSLYKQAAITSTDFRNIFVVRDSDLSIVDQGKYFTDVSEKLAGLRTSEINRIKVALQAAGKLTNSTSSADLSNNVESGHIRKKVEVARDMIEEIGVLAEELDKTNFERLEQVIAEQRERKIRERRELDLLRNAKLRDECLDARDRIAELTTINRELGVLSAVNESEFEAWTHAGRDLKRLHGELDDVRREHARHQEHLAELEETHAGKTASVEAMLERRRRVDDLLEPKVFAYENLGNSRSGRDAHFGLFRWGTILAFLGLLVALFGALVQPTIFSVTFSLLFFLTTAAFAWQLFAVKRVEGRLGRLFVELKMQAAQLGFDVSSLEELLRAKGEFDRQLDEARRVVEGIRVGLGAHRQQFEATGKRIRDIRQEIDDCEKVIATIKINSSILEFGEYQAALKTKKDHVAQKKYLEAVIEQSLGPGGHEDKIEVWTGKLERRLDELVEDNTLPYDERRERELSESIAELETAVDRTDDALKSGRQALRDFESRVRNSGIADPESVVCRTAGELRRLERRLYEFVAEVTERRDDARLAMTILEEIEAEEKTKVVELFGRDKSVSTYFKQITGGKYVEVKFDPDDVQMSVRNPVGDWISADELSGGALDQLYLVIRLSIAESMFGEDHGFFILDDPFVKSDIGRLKNQLALLKTMVAAGWQVLYFSAKKEVYDMLKTEIVEGRIQLIDLDDSGRDIPALPSPARQPAADLFSDGPTY